MGDGIGEAERGGGERRWEGRREMEMANMMVKERERERGRGRGME